MGRSVTISGVNLEVEEKGQGRPVLFLHPGEGLQADRPWFDALAADHRVLAPHHPGFGGSALPDWLGTVDDLAYLYLDLAAQLELENAVLAGACFGGWVAAEMAVRNTARFSGLLLTAPLGIKAGGVLDRDIVDMHAIPRSEFMRLAWADPGQRRDRLYQAGGYRIGRRRPWARGFGGVWLEALHAQPSTETLAASDRHPDPSDLGRAGRHRLHFLRRSMESGNSQRHHRNDSATPVITPIGNSPIALPRAFAHSPAG